jgi:hypothetical protein
VKLFKIAICILLSLSIVGCAVSKNPNPAIRYGVNTGATMAIPGMAVTVIAGSVISDDDNSSSSAKDREQEDQLLLIALMGLGAAGLGFVAGFALGGTVGFFKWMFNSFENDDITNTAPKNVRPPLEPERDTTVHRHYIDMGG